MNAKYPGAYKTRKKDGTEYYRASITINGRHISLGGFDSAEKASAAFRAAKELYYTDAANILDHDSTSLLPHDKWICLCNYRDNGIYIATPVYIRGKYIEYYLSAEQVLKFDIDDLFFYSSHKIMRRKNHLFVADYGMQISLFTRYGLKPYAVEGRDYEFVNGDRTDYRYENIRVLNTYNGVELTQKNGHPVYRCTIHINGYYVVGYYKSQLKAAIAYNKAIDSLKSKGSCKAYLPNYIDGISPEEYAAIYDSVKISTKLL